MAPVKDGRFLPEIWALFSVGVLWVVLRFAVRIRTVGIRGLQIDDGFAFLSVLCWTIIIVGIHITYFIGTNIDYSATEVWALTEHQVEGISFGSKLYVITLYAYIVMIFSLKAIVIILYRRLAFGDWQKQLLNLTIVVCIVGFISTTLQLSLMCLPYKRRFEVRPLPEEKCTASLTFFVALSCFNASSDALLLTIPVPLLWTLKVPLYRRVGVFILLASGIFVMSACIIRVSLTVVPNITVRIIARWGARELAIALVAVNSASLRPILRKSFWMSQAALAEQARNPRQRNLYLFPSLHRIRRHFSKHHPLQSTSAGVSTIQKFAAEQGSTQRTFEDPDYEVITPPARALRSNMGRREGFIDSLRSFGRSAIVTLAHGQSAIQSTRVEVEPDLEKNATLHTTRMITGTESVSQSSRPARILDRERMRHEAEEITPSADQGG